MAPQTRDIEERLIDGKAFELDRLLPLLREEGEAMDVLEGIYRHLTLFMGEASQFDDITMLAIRRIP